MEVKELLEVKELIKLINECGCIKCTNQSKCNTVDLMNCYTGMKLTIKL